MRYLRQCIPCFLVTGLLAACAPPSDPSAGASPAAEESSRGQNLLRIAESSLASGNSEAAIELYRQAAGQSTHSIDPHLRLAGLYRQKKQPENAAMILRQAIRLQPENARLYAELGFALIAAEKPFDADVAFSQALEKDNHLTSAYNGKGVALDKQGKHAEAQALYRRGLDASPSAVALSNNLALSLLMSERYDEAVSLLEPLAARGDATPTIRQNLALAYGLRGDSAKAMEYGLKDLKQADAEANLRFFERVSLHKEQNPLAAEPAYQAAPVEEVIAVTPVHAEDAGEPELIAHLPPPEPAAATEILPEEAQDIEIEAQNTENIKQEQMPSLEEQGVE